MKMEPKRLLATLTLALAMLAARADFEGVTEEVVTASSLSSLLQHRESLRSTIAQRLRASNKKCKPQEKNKEDEDRKCEPAGKQRSGSSCKERCHVWGDPHLAPFWDVCSFHALDDVGGWPLFVLPKHDKREKVNITGVVKKVDDEGTGKYRGKLWTRQLWVDDKMVMDVDQDCKSVPRAEAEATSKGDVILTWSDHAYEKNGLKDIEIEWTSYCHYKHDVWHLNITIDVRDFSKQAFKNAQKRTEGRHDDPPASTVYFKDDFGACTDPVRYGGAEGEANCNRQSDMSLNGRDCSLQAQCAVYGDPHVFDFYSEGQDMKDSFQMPKKPSAQDRVLFSFRDEFAVQTTLDECEFINEVHVYMRQYKEDNSGCPMSSVDPTYRVKTYRANKLCSKAQHTQPETRKRITVPNESDPDYDSVVGGFRLGNFLSSPATPTTATSPQYPKFFRLASNENKVKNCASAFSGSSDFFFDQGGASVTLKCHRSSDGDLYFNVCTEQLGMIKQKFNGNWGEIKNMENIYWGDKLGGNGALKTFQAESATAGWCALGQRLKDSPQDPTASTYEFREPFNFQLFPITDE